MKNTTKNSRKKNLCMAAQVLFVLYKEMFPVVE